MRTDKTLLFLRNSSEWELERLPDPALQIDGLDVRTVDDLLMPFYMEWGPEELKEDATKGLLDPGYNGLADILYGVSDAAGSEFAVRIDGAKDLWARLWWECGMVTSVWEGVARDALSNGRPQMALVFVA